MNKEIHPNVKWVNSLVGRVLYDCVRNPEFSDKIKERIQKKLAAIKLPYFIEDLVITELNLGKAYTMRDCEKKKLQIGTK